ncbi:helix-turn-helix transcriptional regulator [Bacillus spizizenii]|nr:helix-turn-helix transcriptional regulator [Bacillus spizizenii]MCY9056009.1 helix-turn-helix transcriptional regulator [Bacillus spizizenii]MCY9124942.1 helix-turn-helix transcriptional regulator [Bacillus spizizenii]
MSLGQAIKLIRKDSRLTQEELAELANLSRSYVADIERGRYSPSMSTLEKISEALNITVADILSKDNDKSERYDVGSRLEDISEDLISCGDLMFFGEKLSPESIELIKESIDHIKRQMKIINSK